MKCSIDSKTREIIFLDSSECFGVEFDKKTQKLEFSCPKIVGDNLDLSQCICRINYMNAKGHRDSYLIEDILVNGDDVTFTWTLSSKVTAGRGNCSFIFCARQVNENGVIEKEWNTTVAKASIKRGLETNSYIEEEHSDILESILLKLNTIPNTDWNENDSNSLAYLKNRPFHTISDSIPTDDKYIDILNVDSNAVVKLNDWLGMLMLWKNLETVLSNMGSPIFHIKISTDSFDTGVSYSVYTNRDDIVMIDDTNFYMDYIINIRSVGTKTFRLYFILNVNDLSEDDKVVFKSKGIYYRCVDSFTNLNGLKIGIGYKTVKRLDGTYLPNDLELTGNKVDSFDESKSPSKDYPTVNAVSKYVSSHSSSSEKDWNQNDPAKSDYIKSRPGGYYDTEMKTVFDSFFNNSYLLSKANNWTPQDSTNYINFDLEAPVVVAINGIEVGTFNFSKGASFSQKAQTGPSQWTTLAIEPYHIGTKLPDDTTWNDNDWYIEQRIVYNYSNGGYYRRTLVKLDDFASKKFTITQRATKAHAFDSVFTNMLRVRVDNGTKSSVSGADIYKAINQGVYVYCDFYLDDVFLTRAYQTVNPSDTTQPAFFSYTVPTSDIEVRMWLNFYTISSQEDDYTMKPTKEILLPDSSNFFSPDKILKTGRKGTITTATENKDYMTPSMGVTKPASSQPQIAVGDVLSVSYLYSGVPSKWKTTKVDTTVTADSTNLVTSGAVYAAIQEAIANLNNTGE